MFVLTIYVKYFCVGRVTHSFIVFFHLFSVVIILKFIFYYSINICQKFWGKHLFLRRKIICFTEFFWSLILYINIFRQLYYTIALYDFIKTRKLYGLSSNLIDFIIFLLKYFFLNCKIWWSGSMIYVI